jgi:uncharacterized protein (DUF488 family)
MVTIATCGHSNKPIEAFTDLLVSADVGVIIDVRSRPQSRFSPQFGKARLKASLKAVGIMYVWLGNKLGGLDGNIDHEGGLTEALDWADTANMDGGYAAVMCSEAKADKNCHRRKILTPEFQARGARVIDVNWDGTVTPAPLSIRAAPIQEEMF